MNIIDIVVPSVVSLLALVYLYRLFFVKKGCSCSSSCSSAQGENITPKEGIQDFRSAGKSCSEGSCCSE